MCLDEKFNFLESFIMKSKSRSTSILCGDINKDFCDQMMSLIKSLGVSAEVHEIIKARQRERIVNPVLRVARNPLLAKLVVPLFVLQPLFWLALRFVRVRVSEEVIESIEKSDSVVWVGLHEDFDVHLLVDVRVRKAMRSKHVLLLGYPSRETAEKLNMPYKEYLRRYLDAYNTPWEEMKEIAEKLKSQISLGNSMKVQTQRGADFVVRYDQEQHRIESFYGVASEKALEEGRLILLLPAGELSIASVKKPLKISGKMFFDVPCILYDKLVSGVEVVAENGYVIDYSAEKGKEVLDRLFRHSSSRKIYEFGFGLNPAVRPCGSVYLDEKAYKTVHVGFGRPQTPLHVDFVISNPKIFINGHELLW